MTKEQTPIVEVEFHDGVREVQGSMYQAHSVKVYMNANGYKCDVLVNGKLVEGLPLDAIHPNNYQEYLNQNKDE